jgi:hexosaminidase
MEGDAVSTGPPAVSWQPASTVSEPVLRMRARALVQNVPYCARAVEVLVSSTIGTGITPNVVDGSETDRSPDAPVQYYTQDEIREIVAYAKQRAINIIPEIDMPGHADAAVTAYPEHDGGGYQSKTDPLKWPRFTFNPAKKETLEFLDDILAEVAGLFPDAGVIHFGGDEVHFGWHKWPKLPEVQSLMKKEGIKDLAGVEAWFNRRTAATINRLGFKAGGWDEIVASGLAPDKSLVWWWRHDKPEMLKRALDAGFPVILTPRRPCYLDFVQHESHQVGRRWDGYNPLAVVYQFPAKLNLTDSDEAKVRGIQASLWTETTVTQARRDFMTWPRLIALAEAAWTAEEKKDFASFEDRLKPQFAWLKEKGIGYFDPFNHSPEVTDDGAKTEYLDPPP